jgi:MFS family permease
VIGFAMYAMSLIAPQLLELPRLTGYGLSQSMLMAGLVIAPSGLVMMAVSPLSARLSAAFGPKASLLTGALVIAAGYGLALALTHHVWGVLVFSCVIGAGIAFAYAAMPALIMSAVPPSETAAANGLNTLMRSIGTSTSAAVMGVVLSHLTVRLGPATLPSAQGFRVGFVIGGAVALLAALLTLAIPSRRPTTGADGPDAGLPAAESLTPPASARPAAT